MRTALRCSRDTSPYRGPAAFFRLDQIRPGDVIFVDRADGSTVGERRYLANVIAFATRSKD